MDERRIGRAAQLRKGIAGAAAALPEPHAALASRALGAAEGIVSRVEPLDSAGRLDEGIERLERVHYALLRVAVLDEPPPAAGLEGVVEELERLAAEAEAPAAEETAVPG